MTQNLKLAAAPPRASAPTAPPQGGAAHPFLHGPIVPVMLRQAAPILLVLAVQAGVGVAETWFVGRLGTAPLAGMTLVFPVLMLMTMISNGGIGGGISSAVACALGEGRRDDADALVLQAILVAALCGALCTLGAWLGGPALYGWMGGSGEALEQALRYSNVAFAAAVPIWVVNALSAALRGAGNVKVPALVVLGGAALTLLLSPLLIYGLGPVPGLGVLGAGVAMVVYYLLAAAVLLRYLGRGAGTLRLRAGPVKGVLLKAILAVGVPASLSALQSNLIVVIFTGMAGHFGAQALAGYGIGSRLDYLMIPLLFALGTASVAMVGMNKGAGQHGRARQVAVTAAMLSAALAGAIGLLAAWQPLGWVGRFSVQPEVMDAGVTYLRQVAPLYAFWGIGMALVFAGQGAGVVLMPMLIGSVMLVVTGAGSWWMVSVQGGTLGELFWFIGGSRVLFGLLMLSTLWLAKGWRRGPA